MADKLNAGLSAAVRRLSSGLRVNTATGDVAGLADIVGFHGESVAELRAAFEEAVDEYLALCVM